VRGKFFGWWVVLASIVGLCGGVASLVLWTFGVFLKPLTAEFGWSRTQVSAAVLFSTVATVIVAPILGRLVDRIGARRIALPSFVLLGLTFASFSLLQGSIAVYYALFAIIAVLGAGTSSIVYSRVITSWFDRRRGIALGLALAGVGLGAFVMPLLGQALIDALGWRKAYVALAALVVAIALPLNWLLLRDDPQALGQYPDGIVPDGAVTRPDPAAVLAQQPGLGSAEALRSPVFWSMAIAFGLAGFAVTGPMLHLVAMLSDRGMSPAMAAAASSTVGLALLGGRVLAGHLMDRFFAPYVAVGFVLGSVIGLLALAAGASGPLAFAAAVLIGLTAGAEIDVIAFLSSRYFGLRCFGEIYGWQYAAYSAAAGTAPIATAIGFDATGSYEGVLYAFAGLLLLAAVLLARLPRYDRPHAANANAR